MNLAGLTPELLTALPVDRRAVEILRAVTAGEDRWFFSNRWNVLNQLTQQVWRGREPAAARAYEEAHDWLVSRGLGSREPSQHGPDWFLRHRSRLGGLQNAAGLAKVAAAERLSVDLHPRIAERVRSMYLLGEYAAAHSWRCARSRSVSATNRESRPPTWVCR